MCDGLVFPSDQLGARRIIQISSAEDGLTSGSTQNSSSEGAKEPNDVKLDRRAEGEERKVNSRTSGEQRLKSRGVK